MCKLFIFENHVKFTERCVLSTEKHILDKKCLHKGLIWFCHNEPKLKMQSTEWKHTVSQEKKKFLVQWLIKKVMLKVLWNIKGPIPIDFLEEGATINRVSYCQFPWQDDSRIYIYIYIYIYILNNNTSYWLYLVPGMALNYIQ